VEVGLYPVAGLRQVLDCLVATRGWKSILQSGSLGRLRLGSRLCRGHGRVWFRGTLRPRQFCCASF